MDDRWLGAMPVDAFLDKFVPATENELPRLPRNPFRNVPKAGAESTPYLLFISAIQPWIPHLRAVNTSALEDKANGLELKTDVTLYNRVEGVAPVIRTNFLQMELWIKFVDDAPFQDPPDATERSRLSAIKFDSFAPEEGFEMREQLAQYAGAQHGLQSRNFSFSIVVHGDNARFLRWDPSGTIVTAAFNYRTHPEQMAEFLWRFDHLSASQRGHDESIQPADLPSKVSPWVRKMLGIKKRDPLYKYELPGLSGMGYAYGPRLPEDIKSFVSRCTRSLPLVWIPAKDLKEKTGLGDDLGLRGKEGPWSKVRTIYMKDTWRFLSNQPDLDEMPEHEFYAILHEHGTPNIPELVAGGDVEDGKTRAQDFMDAPWVCVRMAITPFQHYRLVHGIVGRALSKFNCTKELVTAVLDAIEAHSHAAKVAKILHRDISAGNIILTNEGKGLLIDWELATKLDGCARKPDCVGTWPFISADLLRSAAKVHTITDDLESFLHVLAWMMLRYVPTSASYTAADRDFDMHMFNERDKGDDDADYGGQTKILVFVTEDYPTPSFTPRRKTPLLKLVQDLSKPFKSLYGKRPSESDCIATHIPFDFSGCLSDGLRIAVARYDEDMRRLASSAWFVDTIKAALDGGRWPMHDGAAQDLPIMPPQDIVLSGPNRVGVQNVQRVEKASRNLEKKRAASPMVGPCAKRRRMSS